MLDERFRLLRAESQAIRQDCIAAREDARRMVASFEASNRLAAKGLSEAWARLHEIGTLVESITSPAG
ncbi:hypothetical protein AYO47_00395 [Planctomyces sp. SCGC AG-212-M04]|nr:hypothetical protein AYO47_00395 [Planctomyces sp. SCGC AG-212-M04]